MRIEKIASLVYKDASVIDIGTDHCYLPIYLYKNNKRTYCFIKYKKYRTNLMLSCNKINNYI